MKSNTILNIFISQEAKAERMANQYFNGNVCHYITYLFLCKIRGDEETGYPFPIRPMKSLKNNTGRCGVWEGH